MPRAGLAGPSVTCGRGGIGRRAALRSLWGNPWKFESSRPHHHFPIDGEFDALLARKGRRHPPLIGGGGPPVPDTKIRISSTTGIGSALGMRRIKQICLEQIGTDLCVVFETDESRYRGI